ncbi:MAG: hypothetical protein IJ799_07365 [Bacteroidales bacterium]|nr:hypothetical protein [Bacteroidales bacterium]
MKKIIVAIVSLLAVAAVASAQPRALGVRVGWGGELSYQHSLGENFLEADLGWTAGSMNIACAYDFSIAPVGPFNFYAGPAADLWLVNEGGIGLGVGAQVGLEYEFDFPLQLSLDWRPLFNIIPSTGFGWQSLALGIRYKF